MDQAAVVRFGQAVAGLRQQVDDAAEGQRAVDGHQVAQVAAVEQLHDVEEAAVGRDAVVVQLDGVAAAQRGGDARLGLEARARLIAARAVATGERLGQDALDRRRPGQEAVLAQPHLAHAALAEQPQQAV